MIRSTLTERWQTTIPAAIRKALRLKPRQQLSYELVDGGVLIRGQCGSLEDFYGCLGNDVKAGTKAQERDAAHSSRVDRYSQPNPPA